MTTTSEHADPAPARTEIAGAELTGGLNGWSTTASAAAGVDEMVLLDGPLGIVSKAMDERDTSLIMPSGTALGATWNPGLVRNIGQVIGQQGVERGVSAILGPNLNMPRSPLTGRGFEMFSEDPYLTGTLGAAWVEGLQSQGVGSCTKHVVANDTETERRRMNSSVEQATLRETYLLPFEVTVRAANPWMLMMAYNRVNGTHCSQNAGLISVLKDEWHYDGVVVSDWYGVDDTVAAANAGLDLEMPGPATYLGARFAEAVASGTVAPERLGDAVERVTRLADRTGRRTGASVPAPAHLRSQEEQLKVLREAAGQSFVLLENKDAILPLDLSRVKTLAVVGPNADKPCFQGGTFATVRPEGQVVTPLDAIREAAGPGVEVLYEPGAAPASALSLTELGSTAPDGTPGVLLEVLPAGDIDDVVYREIRKSSAFVWFGPVPGLGAGVPGRARITARVNLPAAARWMVGAGGTGVSSLRVDGQEVLVVPPPAPDDVMGVVARADTQEIPVDLPAGTVELVIDMAFRPGRVQAITAVATPAQVTDPLSAAVDLAARADAVVVVIGDQQGSSRESADRTTAALDPAGDRLVDAVAGVAANTIVVVNASRAVLLPWADKVKAVLMAWFPGQEFGPALAGVLTGSTAPAGRLPVSFPRCDEDIPGWGSGLDENLTLDYAASEPMGYRHFQTEELQPRYPFGYGLGYTSFELDDAVASAGSSGARQEDGAHGVSVRATVTNTGGSGGRDVVQAYLRAPHETDFRLAGFEGIHLAAGESREVDIALEPLCFRRWDSVASAWVVPSGEWEIRTSRNAGDRGKLCRIPL
ncbi:Beta-glucosidase [Pseudarthrobacter chlorophenolicus A6]|uniref:Beta-glucosidase n=1 Tax=Pseudarthrobacter chlorophenolicus (strain ATCC 700700 / DSM 12829 / CIP 107037 / JCM 12360 / KCTC 9906 / NCIMB 13794 / A6) TaxID=452863 RepID=B8H6H0_PSECP|nr:glycoside hydrolase family 3 C-terminal domain-containing protein [Pseudarthrobacter chlorophenolicus]ACL41496.1 Beta-glucosidase [Pseudarthrobacter chlorophenolicus A6]SDQ63152.1 beta-glucosidase [Pseudarthrobacter chlorophenolicus]